MAMSKWHGGKGDRRRRGADDSAYRAGWDRIFGTGNGGDTSDGGEKDSTERQRLER